MFSNILVVIEKLDLHIATLDGVDFLNRAWKDDAFLRWISFSFLVISEFLKVEVHLVSPCIIFI